MRRIPLLVLVSFASAACSRADEQTEQPPVQNPPVTIDQEPNDPPMMMDPQMMDPMPFTPICTSGARWAAGTTAFHDATDAWGLPALAAEGLRMSAADIDGDGWVDVVLRRADNAGDDFGPGGHRRSWVLRNNHHRGFEDITEASNLWETRTDHGTIGRPGQVVVFADVDNDGDLDAYTGTGTKIDGAIAGETSEIALNDGTGHFALGPEENELRRANDVDAVAGAAFTDFDRDGFVDLWVGEHNYTPAGSSSVVFLQDHLYRSAGTGGLFTEVTTTAGLTTLDWIRISDLNAARAHSRAWSAAACDLNNDGTPELLVASYGRAPNHLWLGARDANGAVTFSNRSIASGYAFDGNQDWTDNEFAKCYCASHRTAQGCAEVAPPRISCDQQNWDHSTDREPFRLGGNSGTSVCADIDNDGDIDVLTTEIKHWWAGASADASELLVNTGDAEVHFDRPGGAATGLVRDTPSADWDYGDMTAAVFDFDNDGWPDIYIGASDYAGNHGLLYHQLEPGRFEEVPITDGIDHHRSHGIIAADFDRDGDLDVLVGHSLARCGGETDCYPTAQVRLFENVLGQDGNWMQLHLIGGAGSNRAAIGARVTIEAGGVTETQEIGGGHGHYGAEQDLVLHFGLGAACEADVTVRWPNADLTTERFHLVAGHRFRIEQGAAAALEDDAPATP